MKKLFFMALVALSAVSCSKDGINLVIENNSGDDISRVICYTVLSGDTVLKAETIKNQDKSSVFIDKDENKTSYNFILEFVRANGSRDISIESIDFGRDTKKADILFTVKETDIAVKSEVK